MKCAFYEREITPPLGCNLPGYFNIRNASDVKDRLYAKAVVVSDGKDKIAVVEVDACFVNIAARERIVARIERFTDIKGDNVCYGANHTHTGIVTVDNTGDEMSDDSAKGYLDFMERAVADCVILADKRLEETEVLFGQGTVEGISFCRNYYMKNTTPSTNPGRLNPDIERPVADTDTDLPVVLFKNKSGKPMGAIISYACHQDCVDGTEFSGDFSSQLSYEMKKLYGDDFVSLFMLGACGNINHFNVKTASDEFEHYRNMGRIIAGEAVKVMAGAKAVTGDSVSAKYKVVKIDKRNIPNEKIEEAKNIVATVKEIPGIKIAADGTDPDQYALAMAKKLLKAAEEEPIPVPLQVLNIADIKIYAYPGEIFYQFGRRLKECVSGDKNIVVTCCNNGIGYIPTEDMLYDTIYESRVGSFHYCDNAGDIMTDKLIELGK